MNKYIALAALLAAGSALANAAEPTLVWDMDFLSTGVTLNCAEGVTTTLKSNVGANVISNGAITLNNNSFSFSQNAGNVSYAEEFSLVAKLSLGSLQPGNWPALFGFGETDAWCWKPSYYVATGTFVLDKDGFSVNSIEKVNEVNKKSGEIKYTLPSEGYGDIIDVAIQCDGKGKISLYVGGELAGYTTITDPAEYGSNKLVKNFTFGARNGGGNKSNITLYDAALYKGLVTSIIPEPSTFGLLAGLGALALVGTRRRRK